jgi:hypothetical protein
MGFIRQQEVKMAVRLLSWQYQRLNIEVPPEKELRLRAEQLVEDAHRIARERGRNVLSILKEMVQNIKKR